MINRTWLRQTTWRRNGNARTAFSRRIPKQNLFFTKPCTLVPLKKRTRGRLVRPNCYRNISVRLVRKLFPKHRYGIISGSILEKNPFLAWSVQSRSPEDRIWSFTKGYVILRQSLWTKLVVGGASSVRIAKKASTQSKWQFNLLIIIIKITMYKWHTCQFLFHNFRLFYINIFKFESYRFLFCF